MVKMASSIPVEETGPPQVLQSNISQRMAGIWFIWFFRSISFVRFDEQERQDRPAHQTNRL